MFWLGHHNCDFTMSLSFLFSPCLPKGKEKQHPVTSCRLPVFYTYSFILYIISEWFVWLIQKRLNFCTHSHCQSVSKSFPTILEVFHIFIDACGYWSELWYVNQSLLVTDFVGLVPIAWFLLSYGPWTNWYTCLIFF